jgi:hypothetical protein
VETLQKSLSLHHYPFFSREKFWFIEKRGEIRLGEPLATAGYNILKGANTYPVKGIIN